MAKKTKKTDAGKQGDYILLDRSGSMSDKWDETISSINGYVHELARKKVDTLVTLAVFDHHDGFQYDVVRRAVSPSDWKNVKMDEFPPRGMTPLYDAVGRIVTTANEDAPEKAAVIIMTDGDENYSDEMNQTDAKAALETCRKKGWSVVFLGADFKNATQASSMGNAPTATMAVKTGNYGNTMLRMASSRASYGVTGQSMSFSDEDRKQAGESDL
jgi:hypothetical protein